MESNNILSRLESLMPPSAANVAHQLADDFRKRRIEKSLTRQDISDKSGVPLANIARFEQKGEISLKNLIEISIALGYVAELRTLFSEPKYTTMNELMQIRRNAGKKKAYHKKDKG